MNSTAAYQNESFIIERLRSGDVNIFEWLFKNKYKGLCYYATKLLGNTSTAEEIVSETFAEIWEKKEKIIFTSSVNAYLYATVHNKSINFLKRQKTITAYNKFLFETKQEFNPADIPDQIYQEKDITAEIDNAIRLLPEKCKAIFMLSRFENKKYREIAEILGISIKTVENQMGIALEKLRKHLQHIMML